MNNKSPDPQAFNSKLVGLIVLMKCLRSLTLLPYQEIPLLYEEANRRRDRLEEIGSWSFPDRAVDVILN